MNVQTTIHIARCAGHKAGQIGGQKEAGTRYLAGLSQPSERDCFANFVQLDLADAVKMEHWTIHDLRTIFSTLACTVLGAEISEVDRILNHVATATTSKIMRSYNKSELFEPRKQVLRQ